MLFMILVRQALSQSRLDSDQAPSQNPDLCDLPSTSIDLKVVVPFATSGYAVHCSFSPRSYPGCKNYYAAGVRYETDRQAPPFLELWPWPRAVAPLRCWRRLPAVLHEKEPEPSLFESQVEVVWERSRH